MTRQPSPSRTRCAAMSILCAGLVGSATIWGAPAASAAPGSTMTTVRYDLAGSGVAGYVTYQTRTGQQHATNVTMPWSVQYTDWVSGSTNTATHLISAQGLGPGSLTCTVALDGKVVSRNTATGDPPRVLCENHDSPTPESGEAG